MAFEYSDERPLQLAVLISGGGSTLANLVEWIADGRLKRAVIGSVISSRAEVRGVEIARAARLPLHILRPRDFPDADAFAATQADLIDKAGADLIVMAGYLCMWQFPERFAGRVLNIHPALLPAFGGAGMYGRRVHEAVLAAGVAESGCTVHLADHLYDHGPIIARRTVAVMPGDTPESLAARVGEAERELYPEVIQRVADEGLEWLARFRAS
ncbi:MAG: phosphoribosylglycinamide formyltransferase [Phycisphaerae bacterium]|nr:phosphoribosylglycinamide formyltransferase [Phycisphaerae bacterium]